MRAHFPEQRLVIEPRPDNASDLFTHKNGDFGAIVVKERSYAAPILKVEGHTSDRCS